MRFSTLRCPPRINKKIPALNGFRRVKERCLPTAGSVEGHREGCIMPTYIMLAKWTDQAVGLHEIGSDSFSVLPFEEEASGRAGVPLGRDHTLPA